MTIRNLYFNTVLKHPILVCFIMLNILVFFSFYIKDFRLDASADSLLLDDDKDLKIFRDTSARYGTSEFLFVTFEPKGELFSETSLDKIRNLREDISQLDIVESVISLVDVPLVMQVEGPLSDVAKNMRTIEGNDVDIKKAKQELLNSPIYKELIVSADGTITALQVNLKVQEKFHRLIQDRSFLVYKKSTEGLSKKEQEQLAKISSEYFVQKKIVNKSLREGIENIRQIIDKYKAYGELYIGGAPMIANDMISFIKKDLVVFGLGVFCFLIFMLAIIFRSLRWVALPLLSCFYASLFMIGLLGFVGWDVTVISSNFISLMLIIAMSMNIHLIVRYRQLAKDFPDKSNNSLILETICKMVWPCSYAVLTTVLAFTSLTISGIKPVINFGWMMSIGLVVVFITSFVLFPAFLALLPKTISTIDSRNRFKFTSKLAIITENHGNKVLFITVVLAVFSLYGISKLKVENSFINYFHSDTEIYKGLRLVDDKMGGTTSLDIILKLDVTEDEDEDEDEDEAIFSLFDSEQDDSWYTLERIEVIKLVHDYLESLPEVGKVLSLASIIRIGEKINKDSFDAFELAVVSRLMPDKLKNSLINPYVNEENNEARVSIRIKDSLKDLRRKELLGKIKSDIVKKYDIPEDKIYITGLLVLYNNMLQSLFKSQIMTLGFVMIGIGLMLMVLFRSVLLAIIGVIPNLLASIIILGLMGVLNIPLDMMTITIAAITIGIAVDNSIHYIYRFREEFAKNKDFVNTMHYCHANIGTAVFYTAITVIVGFSILMLSNFIPSIYFGLLTAFAMFIALFATLTLLPKLLLIFKPFS